MADTFDHALLDAVRGVAEAEKRLVLVVAALRARGRSWAYIGDLLGVSRQAVWERFHHHQGMP